MDAYHKINSVFKRDKKGQFLVGEWSEPEFEFLAHNPWLATEKVDGTNIRINLRSKNGSMDAVTFGGRTDNAQIPAKLVDHLVTTWDEDMEERAVRVFGGAQDFDVTLYGEGYGAGIQKGGGNYSADQKFVLFDVKVGSWWLKRNDVEEIAEMLDLDIVPVVSSIKTLQEWIDVMANTSIIPFQSAWGDKVTPEGVVLTPAVPLFARSGKRIVTKLKYKDFHGTS